MDGGVDQPFGPAHAGRDDHVVQVEREPFARHGAQRRPPAIRPEPSVRLAQIELGDGLAHHDHLVAVRCQSPQSRGHRFV